MIPRPWAFPEAVDRPAQNPIFVFSCETPLYPKGRRIDHDQFVESGVQERSLDVVLADKPLVDSLS